MDAFDYDTFGCLVSLGDDVKIVLLVTDLRLLFLKYPSVFSPADSAHLTADII